MSGWPDEVIEFWFGLAPEQWWKVDLELDRSMAKRFEHLWKEQREGLPEHFTDSAHNALAAILLFDQFPRNMFRGNAQQFASDPLALAIAKDAVDRGLDEQASAERRLFFYLPFEHSEKMEDQQRSLLLFTGLGDPNLLRFAKLHHDVVERFGRFPHRNAFLGRAPRQAEIDAGDVVPW